MRVLAGDVGATNTRLRLIDCDTPHPRGRIAAEQRFESGRYPTLTALVEEFLAAHPSVPVAAACLAVAGPVAAEGPGQRVQLTNLPWHETSAQMAERLAIPHLTLINDFQAAGLGIEALSSDELMPLQVAIPEPQAPRLVVGAGTGLGVTLLTWQGGGYQALPSEAGHMDFAPSNPLLWQLYESLTTQLAHVSWERLVSGPGLQAIYRFLLAHKGLADSGDSPAIIANRGVNGADSVAAQALDIFIELYGAFTGNLALATLPRGGVFIAGGIAPKIKDYMARGRFINAFRAKGRHTDLLATLPVHLVIQSDVGLIGAGLVAQRLLEK